MRDLYLRQLPPELEERIVRQVRRLHAPEHVATTAWRATEGCGCAPDKFVLGEEVHGLAPYWGTAAGREIDFGVIMRLSYLGVVLDDDAALVMPEAVAGQGAELARVAHRHNASTNLVIYRRDWDGLLGRTPEQLRNFSQTAARRAVALLDTAAPADPDDRLQPLLLPFLREPAWAWDGITVFFDDVPATTGAGGDAYGRFFASFVADLTEAMQRSGRAYRLNIVLPAQALDEQGSYNFARLMKIKKSAERPQADPGAYAKVRTGYTGTSDIVVNFVVLLPEPTAESKKALRARLDASDTVKGMDRDVLLRSLLPLLLPPAATPPPWPLETPETQFDADLAYAKWNFGGVALWGPPGGPGDATTMAQVGENFRPEREALDGLCRWVCPNRVALRLALQAGVAVGAIALGVCWLRAPPSRRRRAVGRVGLWVGGVPTLALAAALLKCDPLLAPWKPGTPSPLAVLLLLILAGGVAVIRRRKARR
jgi:hypothetical protein